MILLAHEILHGLVGAALGLLLTKFTRHARIFRWVLLSSYLIDMDHIVDYLMTVGPRWDFVALTTGSYFVTSGRVMVLLHSWELAILLVIVALSKREAKSAGALLGIGVGIMGHLLVDQITYSQPSWALYFLTARMLHGFADPVYW